MQLVVLLLCLAGTPKADARLVGTWQLNGQSFLTLEASGAGVMEGDPLKWKSDGATLVLVGEDGEADKVPYRLEGDSLTLNVGGMPMTLTRGGKPVAKAGRLQRAAERNANGQSDADADAEAMAQAQQWLAQQQGQQGGPRQPQQSPPQQGPQQPRPQPAGNDQLSRLLLSSNWCWLRYSNGNSYTQKVHFNANGTWEDFSESDIYVNNQYAQTTTQAVGNQTSGGQWAVKGGQLWLSSQDSPQLQPVALTITRNSNGYPIITADGREYSMCR